jgi:hypothetical protein
MLTDPLYAIDTASKFATIMSESRTTPLSLNGSFSLVSETNGKSIRRDGQQFLTISHSESKENPGRITDRVAIRLEVRETDSISGQPVVTQVTQTISSPRGSGYTDPKTLLMKLVQLLTFDCKADGTCDTDTPFERVTRICNGEG